MRVFPNVVIYTVLIEGDCLRGEVDEAKKMTSRKQLNGLKDNWWIKSNVKAYGIAVNEYCNIGKPREVVSRLREMVAKGVKPSYIEVKAIVKKSHHHKIIFVESNEDFIDLLASFLTTPLGSIMDLKKNHKISLGSIRNLYKSVKKLDSSWFLESSHKSLLFNPNVAPHFGYEKIPPNGSEDVLGKYWHGLGVKKNDRWRIICEKKMNSKKQGFLQNPKAIKFWTRDIQMEQENMMWDL
ncbi:unnamed protein product [Sphenostylis stenocarpa]|uniref:Pentatricopeptide repeat-containing protein n=1 Tax=Sphenostylis stenocarpa TaxID=92480 RepID=A0AA86RSB0_9FABA|nr:unnamed protein product [Sphenostylis stenocarpa]